MTARRIHKVRRSGDIHRRGAGVHVGIGGRLVLKEWKGGVFCIGFEEGRVDV